VIESGTGKFLAMPAASENGAGAKLVTVQPANPPRGLPLINGVFVLFSRDRLEPVAIMDGAALTGLRSPAVSMVATRFLAREDASHLVVFGAGVQAMSHVHAMREARPVEQITIVAPGDSAENLVGRLRDLGIEAERGEPTAVAQADIVCTCTTATEPVFEGRMLREGAHVNAMGSFQPTTREIDEVLLNRSVVVVEDREAALAEAGDLSLPAAKGTFDPGSIAADLAEVVRGDVGRVGEEQITTFKSVGCAWEDLVVAQAAWDRIDTQPSPQD
jgi:ornithine cyclodeaminase